MITTGVDSAGVAIREQPPALDRHLEDFEVAR
jgi:hypothetical protein